MNAPGYGAFSVEEILVAGEATDVKYRLRRSGGALEVTVEGDRPPREVTKRTLEQREIDRIPGTNGGRAEVSPEPPRRRASARDRWAPHRARLRATRTRRPSSTGRPSRSSTTSSAVTSVVPTEVLEKIDFYPRQLQ